MVKSLVTPNHLVFNFFPAFQALFHQHLRGEGEGVAANLIQLLLAVAESGTQSAEGVGGADDDGIADFIRGGAGLFEGGGGVRLDGPRTLVGHP